MGMMRVLGVAWRLFFALWVWILCAVGAVLAAWKGETRLAVALAIGFVIFTWVLWHIWRILSGKAARE